MNRSRAWRRYKNYTKAKRKRDIDAAVYSYGNRWYPWYNNLHQYSKNKIHCSCPICAAKTRNKGKHKKRYIKSINYTMMDKKRQDAMTADELEYDE